MTYIIPTVAIRTKLFLGGINRSSCVSLNSSVRSRSYNCRAINLYCRSVRTFFFLTFVTASGETEASNSQNDEKLFHFVIF